MIDTRLHKHHKHTQLQLLSYRRWPITIYLSTSKQFNIRKLNAPSRQKFSWLTFSLQDKVSGQDIQENSYLDLKMINQQHVHSLNLPSTSCCVAVGMEKQYSITIQRLIDHRCPSNCVYIGEIHVIQEICSDDLPDIKVNNRTKEH